MRAAQNRRRLRRGLYVHRDGSSRGMIGTGREQLGGCLTVMQQRWAHSTVASTLASRGLPSRRCSRALPALMCPRWDQDG
jgi:hypothetical protein